MRLAPLALCCLTLTSGARGQGAPSRLWRPEDRTLVTDLSRVAAVAVTQAFVYAATRQGLAVYDRAFGTWRETVGTLDGYPAGLVLAMVADPADDTAWLAGDGFWSAYQPVGRRWDTGPLPGRSDLVVLDGGDPSRGAYFRTAGGWYFVPRGSIAAQPASGIPPAGRRIAGLSAAELLARAPAFDAVRFRIERDDMLRTYRLSSAALVPAQNEVYVGTDGNGVFRVDLLTYGAERLPAGLAGTWTGAVATDRERICAATSVRLEAARRGITCFRRDLDGFSYYEGEGLAGLPGTEVRHLLLTPRAIWAATNAGAVRVAARGGATRLLRERDGLPSDDVRALAPASDGIWVGTARGVAVVPDSASRTPAAPVAIAPSAVLALAANGDTLWIGTATGLLALLPGAAQPVVVGPDQPSLRDPVVALAVRGDTVLVATENRLAWRDGQGWLVAAPPGPPVGRITALAPDTRGFWVAGTEGLAFFQPATGVWNALVSPGDLPLPINDVAADGEYVWLATPVGVVRLARRVLVP